MGRQNATRPSKVYNCSMVELYAGLEMIWCSQKEHEVEFEGENTFYYSGISDVRLAKINDARMMPDGQARGAESEVLRLRMIEKLDVVLGRWNSLKGYVRKAFKEDYYKPRIEEAGKSYYFNSVRKNWEDVRMLLQSGKNFLEKHELALKNDGGMPASFIGKFEIVAVEFEELYGLFMRARQDAREQTDAKIMANNLIFEEGKSMMRDGRRIFRKRAAVRNRFVWKRVLGLVRTKE